jgi:hypothetical protein
MPSSTIATLCVCILAGTVLLADIPHVQTDGGPVVRVGTDQSVSTSLPARPLVEPHLAANPTNPRHLVGAAIMSVREEAALSQTRCVALATFDGARTWVTHEFGVPWCNDPWVAILDDGTAIFVGLEIQNRRVVHLWLFRSPDGGRTWSTNGHSFGPGHDHATLIVNRSTGRFHGALYVASIRAVRDASGSPHSLVFVARSMDGGKRFSQITEHEMTTNLGSITLTAALLPDGAVLVPVGTFNRRVADSRQRVALQRRLDWVIRSDDGAARFGPPMLITDRCGGADTGGGVGFHSLAVDLSQGPHRGRAYYVCHEGHRSGPFVIRSDDRGGLWSDPVHVRKTPPSHASGQRRTPSVAINNEGIVAVSWDDRGPDPSSTCWDVFVAVSGDGGETFTDAYKVSTKPSCPAAGDNGWTAERWPFGGDYSGVAAAADGTFHLFWADSRGDRYELRTAQVRVTR